MKILMLKGLPASGKSTFAKKLVSGDIRDMGQNWVRINKDDLRSMMHDGHWSKGNEKVVVQARNVLVINALNLGCNVVVDDTNFAPVHESELRMIAEKKGAEFDTKFFDLDPETCIERDLKRPVSVGSKVIMQMYDQYLKPVPAPPIIIPDAPWAIICDIDGTLAKMKDRGPFDWKRVGEDELVREVAFVLERFKFQPDVMDEDQTGIKILLLSGRDSVCRPETEKWLADNNVRYDELLMRPEGDNRKDNIVKQEIYDQQIVGKYNIEFVLDDRDQVVKMWRANGLKCFQVAEGNF